MTVVPRHQRARLASTAQTWARASVISTRSCSTSCATTSTTGSFADVRTRFAPSPTGALHLGGLRTALFSYALAKRHGGQFVLRIEDTDAARTVPGAQQEIIDMLQWADLQYDEGPVIGGPFGPYVQSQRKELYTAAAQELIDRGHAYKCFCTSDRLDSLRERARRRGEAFKYDRRCAYLSPEEVKAKEAAGEPFVVRMKVPDVSSVVVKDAVRGHVTFLPRVLDDSVLLKSDGLPTYHLACVVDDSAMKISHIIRGEEWLPSAPKHVLLFNALEKPMPEMCHLPLLLNKDGSKLSKRQGHSGVKYYKEAGFDPAAIINFVSMLGWGTKDGREILDIVDITNEFSIEHVHKGGAIVSLEKLEWLNQSRLRAAFHNGDEILLHKSFDELRSCYGTMSDERAFSALKLVIDRCGSIPDMTQECFSLFNAPDWSQPQLKQELDKRSGPIVANMEGIQVMLQGLASCSTNEISESGAEKLLFASKNASKKCWPQIRFLITGRGSGPELPQIIHFFGPQQAHQRLAAGLQASGASN